MMMEGGRFLKRKHGVWHCEISRPSVAIITVCLNAESTLEHTILSVLGQSYPNIEHIIVDGGSRDGTLQILEKYSDKVAYWLSEKDRCVSEGCNKGIRLATADILMFLSADDFLETDFCEKMVRCFESNPAIDYVYGDIIMCDKNGKPLYKVVGERINYFGVKRNVYQELGGYDETMPLNNDVDFLRRMDAVNKVGEYCSIPRSMRAGGMTQSNLLCWAYSLRALDIKNGVPHYVAYTRCFYNLFLHYPQEWIRFFLGDRCLVKLLSLKDGFKRMLGMRSSFGKI